MKAIERRGNDGPVRFSIAHGAGSKELSQGDRRQMTEDQPEGLSLGAIFGETVSYAG
jgi:hypothetical protein